MQEQPEQLIRNVERWNQWRREQPDIRSDLSRTNLHHANLSSADLSYTNLRHADLSYADLSSASLIGADLSTAEIIGANLSNADLGGANLSGAKLTTADLSNADLSSANLFNTNLGEANLFNVHFYYTAFAEIDLSHVKRLETAIYHGRSIVDINSVLLPTEEHIRKPFLRGVGFTETQIEYLPSLLTSRPVKYSSLFISYAHQDQTIAKRLHSDLYKHDVPCWFAPHDLHPGTPILRGLEEAIHLQDKFLLILSKDAVDSVWIEREVDAALHLEICRGTDVLFPIRLDDAVLESSAGWAIRLQHRHIGDFTGWQDETAYQEAFSTLLRHLKVAQPPVR